MSDQPAASYASTTTASDGVTLIGEKLAPFNPTPHEVIAAALKWFSLDHHDVLYDLGCGDGRLLITAAKNSHVRCIGLEYDEKLAARATQAVKDNNVDCYVTILHDNILNHDLKDATAIFAYLMPKGLQTIKARLQEAHDRGVRIVTYVFSMPGWEPVATESYKGLKVYFYHSHFARTVQPALSTQRT